jgi:excisionase family DNA binding protein
MVLTLAGTPQIPRIAIKPDEAAEATGFSRTRIFNAIRDGEMTAHKDGKATIIEVAEVVRWVRSLPTRGKPPEAVSTAAV